MDLSKLNEKQKEAVMLTEGPVMVIAGAGSGKTRVLTYRIAYLIEELGILPESILALTFTNKAAREMKGRIEKMLDKHIDSMWISTFHSFGARFLRKEITKLGKYTKGFTIIDDQDQEKIIKALIKDQDSLLSAKDVLLFISKIKNFEAVINYKDPDYDILYSKYDEFMIQNNLLDFDDLLYLTYKILESDELVRRKYQAQFSYILIDEYQDTNKIQYMLIELLASVDANVFVVGDMNQSIYSFRGARIENIDKFAKRFGITSNSGRIIKLEDNYRSTDNILGVANSVIKKNNSFVKMELKTHKDMGDKVKLIELDTGFGEVNYVATEIMKLKSRGYSYQDMAVMYRVNSLSLGFETEFMKRKIPFVIYGGVGYYSRKEVKDIIAYIRLALNPKDDFSFKRIVNEPKRKIGPKQIDNLTDVARGKNCSLFEAIEPTNQALYSFKLLIEKIAEAIEKRTLVDLIDYVADETGYKAMLEKAEEDERIDNINELKTIMRDLQEDNIGKDNKTILNEFLLDLALKTDVDNIDEENEKVKLMTVHQAKGLEYKVVFLVALEQGIFPSSRSFYSPYEFEEERRIFYVGVTRAMEKLYLTSGRERRIYGNDQQSIQSVFVREIDKKYLDYNTNTTNSYANKESLLDKLRRQKEEKRLGAEAGLIDVGDKVRHKTFGDGVVVKREEDIITVAFKQNYGIKLLFRKHPSITKIEPEK